MKRTVLLASAAVVAAVPAVLGIAGNATFSQSVPALVPAGASILPAPAVTDDASTNRPAVAPTNSAGLDDRGRRGATGGGHGADDSSSTQRSSTTGTTVDDRGRRGATGGGHGTDDSGSTRPSTHSTSTRSSTSGRSTSTSDDHGGDDSGNSGTGSGKGSDD